MEGTKISRRTPDDHVSRSKDRKQSLYRIFSDVRHDGLDAAILQGRGHLIAVKALIGIQSVTVVGTRHQGDIGARARAST